MRALFEPWGYEFARNGVLAATIAGALCGLVGTFVVLRRMSYIGHGLAHSILGGAVASYVVSFNVILGATIWGVGCTAVINAITRRRPVGADAAIGVVTTASFAFGVALISRYGSFTRDFEAILFGDALAVRPLDLLLLAVALALAAGSIIAFYRPLLFTTFDPEVADVSGVPTARVDLLFSVLLAITVIATMRVLGVTLVAAALVTPTACARMLTASFNRVLAISVALGAAFGFVGFNASYHADVSAGAAIVLVGAAAFAAAFAVTGPAARRATRR